IIVALIVIPLLMLQLRVNDLLEATTFYQHNRSLTGNASASAALPTYLANFKPSEKQLALPGQIIRDYRGPAEFERILGQEIELDNLIGKETVNDLLDQGKKPFTAIDITPKPDLFLYDSFPAVRLGLKYARYLSLKAILHASRHQNDDAVSCLQAALIQVIEAARPTQGMFFDLAARLQTGVELTEVCKDINLVCYLTDLSEYQASVLLEQLKQTQERLVPVKAVLQQYRDRLSNFAGWFRGAGLADSSGKHSKYEKNLKELVPHYKIAFDRIFTEFLDVADVSYASASAMLIKNMEIREHEFKRIAVSSTLMMTIIDFQSQPMNIAIKCLLNDIPDFRQLIDKHWIERQQIEGCRTMLALEAYRERHMIYPDTIVQLNDFFKQTFGKDVFNDQQLYFASEPVRLQSSGHDMKAGSADDIMVFPDTMAAETVIGN
ncbi:MAG: hypothetical protein AB1403_03290, partial [Candidatus Riflebacteria bacterium]